MDREDYIEILEDIIRTLETSDAYKHLELDISDIGNEVGIAFGRYIVKNSLGKDDFIHGIMHGISLMDGTH